MRRIGVEEIGSREKSSTEMYSVSLKILCGT